MTWHSLERFGTELAFWICAFAIGLAVVFRKDQQRRDARSSQQIAMDRTNAYNERRARTEKTHSSPSSRGQSMDKGNGTINTRLTIVNVQALGDGGERITVAPNDTTGSGFKASGSIDLTFTDKAQVGLYKAGDAFNVTFSPTLDVTNRQRSANAAEHISTR